MTMDHRTFTKIYFVVIFLATDLKKNILANLSKNKLLKNNSWVTTMHATSNNISIPKIFRSEI